MSNIITSTNPLSWQSNKKHFKNFGTPVNTNKLSETKDEINNIAQNYDVISSKVKGQVSSIISIHYKGITLNDADYKNITDNIFKNLGEIAISNIALSNDEVKKFFTLISTNKKNIALLLGASIIGTFTGIMSAPILLGMAGISAGSTTIIGAISGGALGGFLRTLFTRKTKIDTTSLQDNNIKKILSGDNITSIIDNLSRKYILNKITNNNSQYTSSTKDAVVNGLKKQNDFKKLDKQEQISHALKLISLSKVFNDTDQKIEKDTLKKNTFSQYLLNTSIGAGIGATLFANPKLALPATMTASAIYGLVNAFNTFDTARQKKILKNFEGIDLTKLTKEVATQYVTTIQNVLPKINNLQLKIILENKLIYYYESIKDTKEMKRAIETKGIYNEDIEEKATLNKMDKIKHIFKNTLKTISIGTTLSLVGIGLKTFFSEINIISSAHAETHDTNNTNLNTETTDNVIKPTNNLSQENEPKFNIKNICPQESYRPVDSTIVKGSWIDQRKPFEFFMDNINHGNFKSRLEIFESIKTHHTDIFNNFFDKNEKFHGTYEQNIKLVDAYKSIEYQQYLNNKEANLHNLIGSDTQIQKAFYKITGETYHGTLEDKDKLISTISNQYIKAGVIKESISTSNISSTSTTDTTIKSMPTTSTTTNIQTTYPTTESNNTVETNATIVTTTNERNATAIQTQSDSATANNHEQPKPNNTTDGNQNNIITTTTIATISAGVLGVALYYKNRENTKSIQSSSNGHNNTEKTNNNNLKKENVVLHIPPKKDNPQPQKVEGTNIIVNKKHIIKINNNNKEQNKISHWFDLLNNKIWNSNKINANDIKVGISIIIKSDTNMYKITYKKKESDFRKLYSIDKLDYSGKILESSEGYIENFDINKESIVIFDISNNTHNIKILETKNNKEYLNNIHKNIQENYTNILHTKEIFIEYFIDYIKYIQNIASLYNNANNIPNEEISKWKTFHKSIIPEKIDKNTITPEILKENTNYKLFISVFTQLSDDIGNFLNNINNENLKRIYDLINDVLTKYNRMVNRFNKDINKHITEIQREIDLNERDLSSYTIEYLNEFIANKNKNLSANEVKILPIKNIISNNANSNKINNKTLNTEYWDQTLMPTIWYLTPTINTNHMQLGESFIICTGKNIYYRFTVSKKEPHNMIYVMDVIDNKGTIKETKNEIKIKTHDICDSITYINPDNQEQTIDIKGIKSNTSYIQHENIEIYNSIKIIPSYISIIQNMPKEIDNIGLSLSKLYQSFPNIDQKEIDNTINYIKSFSKDIENIRQRTIFLSDITILNEILHKVIKSLQELKNTSDKTEIIFSIKKDIDIIDNFKKDLPKVKNVLNSIISNTKAILSQSILADFEKGQISTTTLDVFINSLNMRFDKFKSS